MELTLPSSSMATYCPLPPPEAVAAAAAADTARLDSEVAADLAGRGRPLLLPGVPAAAWLGSSRRLVPNFSTLCRRSLQGRAGMSGGGGRGSN